MFPIIYFVSKITHGTFYDFNMAFNIDNFSDEDFVKNFRFKKDDFAELYNALRIPDLIRCPDRTSVSGPEALAILIRRLAYPNRLSDLVPIFDRSQASLSQIVNHTTDILYNDYSHKFYQLNQHWIMQRIPIYCAVGVRNGSPLNNCFGYIDGTVRPICRPGIGQDVFYNGHHRTHAMKVCTIKN